MDIAGLERVIDQITQFLTGIWLLIKPMVIEITKTVVSFVIEWLKLAISALQDLLQRIV